MLTRIFSWVNADDLQFFEKNVQHQIGILFFAGKKNKNFVGFDVIRSRKIFHRYAVSNIKI